ncbi:uncharacterized protein RSE6_07723 [Rhynchosporium secalis]|uniref:Uncharacterized protein n=1 Tax=Rhynchosporium secalis TaxID=38038 RepID=A0A1E1MDM2_RHYSE|nr:uncharacterized protein RSE6_07723 [Rhynchosporium secalis]
MYLLTAKIIKACAALYLYEKIEKILGKLGGNGKSNWKPRVKFVYNESEIRKLLKRLRDMKGTLATIMMSLQVDLQLSLLRGGSDVPLEPETLRNLKEAQESVRHGGLETKYPTTSQKAVESSAKSIQTTSSSRGRSNSRQSEH